MKKSNNVYIFSESNEWKGQKEVKKGRDLPVELIREDFIAILVVHLYFQGYLQCRWLRRAGEKGHFLEKKILWTAKGLKEEAQ